MQTSKNTSFELLKKRFFRLAALLALCFPAFSPSPAFAVITQSINYQGFLLSKLTNLPVETPQDLKFIIYNLASGGGDSNRLFIEERCNLGVSKGRYDVEIGSKSGGIPDTVFLNNQNLWLEIQVDADGDCLGNFEAMTPRVRLQASPFAFNSLYASTASAATPVFLADVIGALPNTQFGAVTISSNLFVQGGISVGSISPGQKLAVAGVVESTGVWPTCANPPNYTCGFKFPDGSVQVKAAALTMWDVLGVNLYSINPGNLYIGHQGVLYPPQARVHISSGPGETSDLLLVSTGTGVVQSKLFRVNGLGEAHGLSFHGNGATLTGIVRQAGDTMTGQLTLAASSLTVTSPQGISSPKVRLNENVEISAAPPSAYGGIYISSHLYLAAGATYYGDGSGLYNVSSTDTTKVLKSGDTMTGPLNVASLLTVSTLAVTNSAFSVSGTTFSVLNGNTALGGASLLNFRLTVNGGVAVTSSITVTGAQGTVNAPRANFTESVDTYLIRATTGTFGGFGPNQYSIDTASGIWVKGGVVVAPKFIGDGSQLTSVTGTDNNRVLKTGDIMTGHLGVLFSSVTLVARDTQQYSLTVKKEDTNLEDPGASYVLAVTTFNVGVQVLYPEAPLEVNKEVLVSNINGPAQLRLKSNIGHSYLNWSDSFFSGTNPNQGSLGFVGATRDLVYRAMGSDPITGGAEVFRIRIPLGGEFLNEYFPDNWRFGIGTADPQEYLHIAANMLVSDPAATPILYISTTSGGVSVKTTAQTHALSVNGGINAVSSITAQGGFYGDGSGLTRLSDSSLPQTITVGSITAIAGNVYDGVVFSTTIYATSRLSVGRLADPMAEFHLFGAMRLQRNGESPATIDFNSPDSGDAIIRWNDPVSVNGPAGVLGIESGESDLVYRGGTTNMDENAGKQAFRVKPNGYFIMGSAGLGYGLDSQFVPAERFHVLSNMIVSAPGSTAVLFISTGSAMVGISTGTPKERMHVASSFLVGPDRTSAVLYVSTQSGTVGVNTGNPNPLAKMDVNGWSVFRSSLSVTGAAGLSGAQSAFEVIGSTLVVRYDGKVGIGVATPTENLEVAGKVKAAGFVAARELKSTNCPSPATSCTATCVNGGNVMGGGCADTGTGTLNDSYPSAFNAWTCSYTGAPTDLTAYAICSTVE